MADVDVTLDLMPLRTRDSATRRWSRRPGDWRIVAAQVSPDPASLTRGNNYVAVWAGAETR